MNDEALQTWNYFHDWYLDSLSIGPNIEPRTFALGLHLESRRAVVTFNGATCVAVDRLGLLNIVYGIHVISPEDAKYERACRVLATGERLTNRKANTLAFVYSTLGAELAIECDSVDARVFEEDTVDPGSTSRR
ncbi:hypothetical protein [Caballeronia sp. S22]|uniref:hypothetical protein n=1 Tax=Caballeronia sp. S22 TaxID=3137182 RepID=UPI003530B78E